ncbi:MAG TPA: urease accessory protein UreE [Burkholderiales bacterium]|nr:urease accessory protein UreE [Burkholderiales bacterium]
MIRIERIIGLASEPKLAEALHELEHRNAVEYLSLSQADTQRHRLRALTDRGTECAIALPRTQHLMEGAVLLLEAARGIVVRMHEVEWLEVEAKDVNAALELGYFAGNMHWKVEFHGTRLRIALAGPREDYLHRMTSLLHSNRVTVFDSH